ncbi:hypothetical protein GCM10022281_25290 [Sphingomonas rosea]|uniref:Uncharacterized protein n=1 Tax=Sphingomonas rosea TaxID=335605 RepID=A0ABP7UGZ3_9SPHN
MLFAFLMLSTGQPVPASPPPAVPPKVATQTCADGAVILATDRCLVFPDHRYLLDHEPQRRILTERWWCGRSKEPNEARVSVELVQPTSPTARTYWVARLLSLTLDGRPAPRPIMRKVETELGAMAWLTGLGSRCLFVQPNFATIGILTMKGSQGEYRTVELR